MNKNYIIAATTLLILGAIILFLPEKSNSKIDLTAEKLMMNLIESSRFMDSDNVANMIITNDPSLQLIDVRTADEFAKYHLRGAINIPLAEILEPKWEAYLNQVARKNVFYSNGSVLADQAWILCKRQGFIQNYILVGGLNNWMTTIISPEKPENTEDNLAWEKYNFRKAASQYFLGGTTSTVAPVRAANPVVKRKKKAVQGGC